MAVHLRERCHRRSRRSRDARERPSEASVDKYGLGDIYVPPLKLGWKLSRLDLVAGYAFDAPTGRFEPDARGGVGRGQTASSGSPGPRGTDVARAS